MRINDDIPYDVVESFVVIRKRVFDYHDLPGMDDCQMDAACTPSLANQSHLDITLNASIAANQIAVGGHKRAWDNTEEPDFKRIRHTGTVLWYIVNVLYVVYIEWYYIALLQ